jgi:fermentation-respiration switch protein FrsA (DUF1100 family)
MRVMMNIALSIVIAYAVILLLVFAFQSRLVYFPQVERELTTTPRTAGLDYEDVSLRTADGVTLHGWWVPARNPRGAALILHGNAGNISHRLGYLLMFYRLGYASVLIDYRGYGKSGGAPGEEGTYRDAEAAWQYLTEARKLKPRDIVVVGESLGGGIATWLAAKYPPRALVLLSTFTSVPDFGAQVYPWLPVRWLARIKYDNLSRIAKIAVPVLIAHSRDDDIIPFSQGQALFAMAREPKQFLEMRGGHNDGFIYGREEWVAALGAFLEKAANGK